MDNSNFFGVLEIIHNLIEHDCVGELKEWKNYAAMDDKYKAALRWLLFEDNEGKTRDIKLFKRLEELLRQGKLMKCAQIDQKIRSRANIGSRKDNKKRQKQKMKNTVSMQDLAKSFGNISIDDNPRARPSARNGSKSVFDEEFLKPMFALDHQICKTRDEFVHVTSKTQLKRVRAVLAYVVYLASDGTYECMDDLKDNPMTLASIFKDCSHSL